MNARYSFGIEGQKHLIMAAADAIESTVQPYFEDSEEWSYDKDYFSRIPALKTSPAVMAFGGWDVAGIVMCFIGAAFATKIFDEVYERTLKRPIGKQLDLLLNTISIPEGKSIEYRDIIYFEDIQLVVVIRVIAGKNCGQELEKQVMQAHLIAHTYIEQNGRKAPIHCHKIIDGRVEIEPELYSTLDEIKKADIARVRVIQHK